MCAKDCAPRETRLAGGRNKEQINGDGGRALRTCRAVRASSDVIVVTCCTGAPSVHVSGHSPPQPGIIVLAVAQVACIAKARAGRVVVVVVDAYTGTPAACCGAAGDGKKAIAYV